MSLAAIIAMGTAIAGLIVSMITVTAIIRKAGKVEQAFHDGLARLDEMRTEDQKRLTGIAEELKSHTQEPGIHVNPLVEQREHESRVRFEDEVNRKLQRLLEK